MEKHILNTNRVLTIRVFPSNGDVFFRTREVAGVLGVKQQFELTADIKEMLGEDVIKKGDDTLGFRDLEEDDNRTTFISATDLKYFLKKCSLRHKIIPTQKEFLLRELSLY